MCGDRAACWGNEVISQIQPKIKRFEGYVLGQCGSCRDANLIAQSELPVYDTNEDPMRWCVETLLPEIFERLKDEPRENELNRANSVFLVGMRGRLFSVSGNGSLVEPDLGFYAIGSGSENALGSLASTVGGAPKERLLIALKVSVLLCGQVRPPFDFLEI